MKELVKKNDGAGGEMMQTFLNKYVFKHFLETDGGEISLSMADDSAVMNDVVFTIDGHTVYPLFFPGGDIGKIGICGTVNDISVMGAIPMAVAVSLIIEEGITSETVENVVISMKEAALEAGVNIVTGDTKVVERGGVKEMVLSTSAFGKRMPELDRNFELAGKRKTRWLTDNNIMPGDKIIVTGTLGDHGMALFNFREGYKFESPIQSDVAPLNHLMREVVKKGGIASAKDMTRGGMANTLNELSSKSKVGIKIYEEALPVKEAVRSSCGIFGYDPINIGNEGKIAMAVNPEMADEVLKVIKRNKYGKDAAIIGEATDEYNDVVMATEIGGMRRVDAPVGDPIPRIC